MRYWTSDYHFSHPSIIKYCGRKFKNVERMTEVYIQRANMRAKNKDDVIIHVGDFCCWGNERGIKGSKIKAQDYIDKFNATVILLEGNHDSNNKVKSYIKTAFVNLGNAYTNVSVGHYPSHYEESANSFFPGTLRLCGHVHGNKAWKWYWDSKNRVLNINVGIDHWKQGIVSDNEIIVYANDIIRKLSNDMNYGMLKRNNLITKIINIFRHEKNKKIQKYQDSFPQSMPREDRFGDLQFVYCKKDSKSRARVYQKNKQ